MRKIRNALLTRRAVIKHSLIGGAGLTLVGRGVFAADSGASLPLITKAIPSTGERLPVIGLGTNAFSVTEADELAARKEVLQHFPQLGARVVDTARGYGEAEVVIGKLISELGNRDRLFLATKTTNRGQPKPGNGELEEALARLQTTRIDLLQVHNFNGVDELFPRGGVFCVVAFVVGHEVVIARRQGIQRGTSYRPGRRGGPPGAFQSDWR